MTDPVKRRLLGVDDQTNGLTNGEPESSVLSKHFSRSFSRADLSDKPVGLACGFLICLWPSKRSRRFSAVPRSTLLQHLTSAPRKPPFNDVKNGASHGRVDAKVEKTISKVPERH